MNSFLSREEEGGDPRETRFRLLLAGRYVFVTVSFAHDSRV